jgi:hypothetical protein
VNQIIRRSQLLLLLLACGVLAAGAAENLRMRDGISFFHDLDQGFPILADKIDDMQIAQGKATLIFFGASGDLNTNRQAKRIVDLYRKYKSEPVKFVLVDVDKANTPAIKALVRTYYTGYIPGQVIFDKQGKQKWNHTGEVDENVMAAQLDKII